MNRCTPLAPPGLPLGFFRFTRWSSDPAETFPTWTAHFHRIGIRVFLGHSEGMVALFREGEEAVSSSGIYARKSKETK